MYLASFVVTSKISNLYFLILPGDSLVLDVIPGPSEDIFTGQTLKCSLVTQHAVEEQKYESDILREFIPKGTADENNVSFYLFILLILNSLA